MQAVSWCLGCAGAGAGGIERAGELLRGVEPLFAGAALELVPGVAPVLVDALVELVPGACPLVVVVWLVDLLLLPQATRSAPAKSATSTHAVNFRIDIPISISSDRRSRRPVARQHPTGAPIRRPRLAREYERSGRTRTGRGQSARAKRVRSLAPAPGGVGSGELGRARQVLCW